MKFSDNKGKKATSRGDKKAFSTKGKLGRPKDKKDASKDDSKPFSSDKKSKGKSNYVKSEDDKVKKPFRPNKEFAKGEKSFKKKFPSNKKTLTKGDDKGEKKFSSDKRNSAFKGNLSFKDKIKFKKKNVSKLDDDGKIRLNRFIANAGICSRREADRLIEIGEIKVNGKIITELGSKIDPSKDTVHYGDELVKGEKKQYILLNKPKNYITTSDDPRKRQTVMDLVGSACKERIYPVGRLDRQTTGVLLLTNDGDLTKKLTHPSSKVKKLYHVVLDKNVTKAHLIQLVEGVELEDGVVSADKAMYVENAPTKREIGIELHSGKNRVIRRMMENLGYEIVRLDRVLFAGLSKKNLARGQWRFLTEKEIGLLQRLQGNPNKQ